LDHSTIITTLSTAVIVRKPTQRLHNSKTNWNAYRQIIPDKVNPSIKLKGHGNIELETNTLLSLLQHAAKEATTNSDPQRTTDNIPYEIKRLAAEKRRAKELTHQTAEKYITEQATNLNPNSKKCGIQSLKNTPLILKGKIILFGNL